MKKFFFSLLIVTMICSLIFADDDSSKASSSSTMELSAYKEATTTSYSTLTVSLTYLPTSDSITGSSSYYPLLDGSQSIDRLGSDYSLDEVFSIGITTSLKYNITAELTFTPFINMADSSKEKIPVTYKYSSSTINTAENSSWRNPLAYVTTDHINCQYFLFTPQIVLVSEGSALSSGNTFTADSSSSTVTLTHNIKETKYSDYYDPDSWWANTYTVDGYPEEYTKNGRHYTKTNSDTLPGIGSKTVSTSATFGVSITEENYNKMVANEYYASTITVTVTVQN